MKKIITNEKGVTLVELIAALVIAAIVIGVLTITFMSVNHQWNRSTQKYHDDAQARRAMNLLADDLTDATQVYVKKNEFRFKTGNGDLKAVKYDAGKLILYDYAAAALEQENGTYQNGIELAANAASPPVFNDQPDFSGMIRGGALFRLQVYFRYTEYSVNGSTKDNVKPYTITIKLFKEE